MIPPTRTAVFCSANTDSSGDVPWYRQFWPWLLIALPTAAVLACAATIWLVIQNPDAPVVRDPAPVTEVLSTNSVVPPRQ